MVAMYVRFVIWVLMVTVGKTTNAYPCSHGDSFYDLQKKCFRYIPGRMPMGEAQQVCNHLGGRLAEIQDQATNDFIVNVIPSDNIWIGIFDWGLDGVFNDKWTSWNGSAVTWTRWDSSQPNNYPAVQECVMMTGAGYWQDQQCLAEHAALCEYYALLVPKTCSDIGALFYQPLQMCYWRINDLLTMQNSQRACERNGGRLASLRDEGATKFVIETIKDATQNAWIGVFDFEIGDTWEDTWVYWDGSPVIWTFWEERQPNNYPSPQECVMLSENNQWQDKECWKEFKAICECEAFPLSDNTSSTNLDVATETVVKPEEQIYRFDKRNASLWLVSEAQSFTEAEATCRKNRGRLAIIEGTEMSNFVRFNIFGGRCPPAWIGIRDINTEHDENLAVNNWDNIWVTWDGRHISWTDWYHALNEDPQPNNRPPEQECVRLGKGCQWFDRNCSNVYPFICEMVDDGYQTTTNTGDQKPTDVITTSQDFKTSPTEFEATSESHTVGQINTSNETQTATIESMPESQTTTTSSIITSPDFKTSPTEFEATSESHTVGRISTSNETQTATSESMLESHTTTQISQKRNGTVETGEFGSIPVLKGHCYCRRFAQKNETSKPESLALNKTKLNKYYRRFTSAADHRTSAAVTGYTAIVFVCLVTAFVVWHDIMTFTVCGKGNVIRPREERADS